jgi:multicomponent Na+:H+ antiporter subunit E
VNTVRFRTVASRAVGFFVLWTMFTGGTPTDLLAGTVAASMTTWASLRLLPPATGSVRPAPIIRFALRFLRQSAVAGVDVARRALDPRLPLNPGFIIYPVGLPHGPARNMFTSLMSLLPGTVPIGTAENGGVLIHCLDAGQPVAAQLAAEEALFATVVGRSRADG